MGFLIKSNQSDFSEEYITVNTAVEVSGYNQQYLRRLLREGTLRAERLGQLWLIDRKVFIEYIHKAERSKDKRFDPPK